MSEATKTRGRPAQGPKSGKGAVLTTRITAETRAALEAEAERTGRSISQVAEIWIERGRDTARMLGGMPMANMLLDLGNAANFVQFEEGASIQQSPKAAARMLHISHELIDQKLYRLLWHHGTRVSLSEGLEGEAQAERRSQLIREWTALPAAEAEALRAEFGAGPIHFQTTEGESK